MWQYNDEKLLYHYHNIHNYIGIIDIMVISHITICYLRYQQHKFTGLQLSTMVCGGIGSYTLALSSSPYYKLLPKLIKSFLYLLLGINSKQKWSSNHSVVVDLSTHSKSTKNNIVIITHRQARFILVHDTSMNNSIQNLLNW